jgi:hypothetical protein
MHKRIWLLGLCACTPLVRFTDRAILWHDVDDRPSPQPAVAEPGYHWMAIRDALFLPLDRGLGLDYGGEATNVNAVDEAPDSAWWSDRRRVPGQARPRHFADDEMARGAFGDRPAPTPPFTVVKGKEGGGTLGFIVEDALGRRLAIKLDPPGLVGLATSTEVVVSRLAWAAGWNVPAESLLALHPGDLVLSPKATTIGDDGGKVALDEARFAALLARAPLDADGTIRALASVWIDGVILGPSTYQGRRSDDVNDRVAHQDRRDLRGYGVFCSWVNNIDTTDVNTLDSYVGEPGRGHVVHWQQDVGGSFGARPTGTFEYWMGLDTYVPWTSMLTSLLTLGFWPRPWEGEEVRLRRARELAEYPELGFFDGIFDPRSWHPIFDNPAFARATARDRYWGAKQVLRFDERELRVAIAEGHYRPAAAERLLTILWQRREAIARAYFGDLAPLDYFRVDGAELCWDDLWILAGLDDEQSARYRVDDRVLSPASPRCVLVGEGYRVVTLAARRRGQARFGPSVRVHLVDRRIVGIER